MKIFCEQFGNLRSGVWGNLLLKHLLPKQYVQTVYEIDIDDLMKRGFVGIITDLDNTLVEWDRKEAPAELIQWLKKAEEKGMKLIVVSNNNEHRVKSFVEPLGIPFIFGAKKPLKKSFRAACEQLQLPPAKTVMLGDQLFTDILGANLAGIYTILVKPVVETDGFFTRFNRRAERVVKRRMKKKGLIHWEDKR